MAGRRVESQQVGRFRLSARIRRAAKEREALCDELYRETAAHFRQIRVVEIQKQEQRARAQGREFRTDELAADLWDALTEDEKQPLAELLAAQTRGGW